MIYLEILYDDGNQPMVDVTDMNALGGLEPTGVLAARLCAKKDGTVQPLEYREQNDSYALFVDPVNSIAGLYGWDDSDGGWFHLSNPWATDHYPRPTVPPFLLPYQTTYCCWTFAGSLVSAETWAASEETRHVMRSQAQCDG